MRKSWIALGLAGIAFACAAAGFAAHRLMAAPAAPLDRAALAARLAEPLPAPAGPLSVYHLGHSLVGRDMPVLLAQMAGEGHVSHSQLGWGASLADHWKGDVPGFETENAHPNHRPAAAAFDSGAYQAVVLTEMVELRDAIRWHDSPAHLARWAARARAARPDVRLYLYETWHRRDDPAGWAARIAADRPGLWEGALLAPAMAQKDTGTIRVIPAGQVLAAATAAIEAGQIPGLTDPAVLFTDEIHLSATGAWLVAMVHYAVLYHRPPPETADLRLADGSAFAPPGAEAATALRALVWQTISADPATGIRLADASPILPTSATEVVQ